MSFSSIVEVATALNDGKLLEPRNRSFILKTRKFKEIVDPYISIKDSEARINLRVKDSLPDLRRNDSDKSNKL